MMGPNDYRDIVESLKNFARSAGEEIYKLRRTLCEEIEIYEAPDRSKTATQADKRSHEIICIEGLLKKYPDCQIISEHKSYNLNPQGPKDRIFVVDPIDGTKAYRKGMRYSNRDRDPDGEYSVMIGLQEPNEQGTYEPTVGVVYFPESKKMVWAHKGGGACKKINGKSAKKIQVSDRGPAKARLLLRRSDFEYAQAVDYQKYLGVLSVSRPGSAGKKIVKVAESAAEIFLYTGGKKIWDLTAPLAILREAGGFDCDLNGNRIAFDPLVKEDYNQSYEDKILIIYNKADIKEYLVKKIRARRPLTEIGPKESSIEERVEKISDEGTIPGNGSADEISGTSSGDDQIHNSSEGSVKGTE